MQVSEREVVGGESAHGFLDVKKWQNADVCAWLEGEGLKDFQEVFTMHKVCGIGLLDLTPEDLKDMGVVLVGDRRRVLSARRTM